MAYNLSATYLNLTFGRANTNVIADHEGVTGQDIDAQLMNDRASNSNVHCPRVREQ